MIETNKIVTVKNFIVPEDIYNNWHILCVDDMKESPFLQNVISCTM